MVFVLTYRVVGSLYYQLERCVRHTMASTCCMPRWARMHLQHPLSHTKSPHMHTRLRCRCCKKRKLLKRRDREVQLRHTTPTLRHTSSPPTHVQPG